MNFPFRYISVKLFFLLLCVMLVVFSVHTYLNIEMLSAGMTAQTISSADRATDMILRSTRYSMLLNRKEDVQQIVSTIGSEPGFVGVSVYNKAGEVIFATDTLTIGQTVDLQTEACYLCHATAAPLRSIPHGNRTRIYDTEKQGRILRFISPIKNEPSCSEASCHAHSSGVTVLGVLDVKMSLESVDRGVAKGRRSLIITAIAMTLIICTMSGLFIYRMVRKPIKQLGQGMRTISSGDLSARIPIQSSDEIGRLATSFNKMADDLNTARDELQDWANTLEHRIEMKTEEFEQAQAQIVQMEKMASLGKLSTSIAHEINNPLFGILTYSKLGLRELEPETFNEETTATMKKYLTIIQQESSRCGDIVKNLLDFARQTGGEFTPQHLNQIVDQTLLLLTHHFQMQQIDVKSELMESNDELLCDPKQIQQALIAPCINSVESMPNGGTFTIRTTGDDNSVSVEFHDTGSGIPKEALPRIFEPFFTTKEGEAGLGLGLSVAYGIVQRHKGQITVESEQEKGTTIAITLPRIPIMDKIDTDDSASA